VSAVIAVISAIFACVKAWRSRNASKAAEDHARAAEKTAVELGAFREAFVASQPVATLKKLGDPKFGQTNTLLWREKRYVEIPDLTATYVNDHLTQIITLRPSPSATWELDTPLRVVDCKAVVAQDVVAINPKFLRDPIPIPPHEQILVQVQLEAADVIRPKGQKSVPVVVSFECDPKPPGKDFFEIQAILGIPARS
jgi:hypothetical protein